MDIEKHLEDLVADYITRDLPGLDRFLDRFKKPVTIEEAIRRAALALTEDGKKHSHQRRWIADDDLERFYGNLREVELNLRHADKCNFDELHALVDERRTSGIGPLTVYDTTLRIGANLGVWPRMIYLHAGTRNGVEILGSYSEYSPLIGAAKQKTIELSELPLPIQTLAPHQAENFLCHRRDEFLEDR